MHARHLVKEVSNNGLWLQVKHTHESNKLRLEKHPEFLLIAPHSRGIDHVAKCMSFTITAP